MMMKNGKAKNEHATSDLDTSSISVIARVL